MGVLEPVRTAGDSCWLDDLGMPAKPSAWGAGHYRFGAEWRVYNEKRMTILTTNYFDGDRHSRAGFRVLPGGQRVPFGEKKTRLRTAIGARMRSRLYEMCRTASRSMLPISAAKPARPAARGHNSVLPRHDQSP